MGSNWARMGTKTLEERRNGFENALISDVKKHHSAYLLSLDPPLILSQDSINRWHASFDVDSVREISPDALPLPPDASDKIVYTAKDMLGNFLTSLYIQNLIFKFLKLNMLWKINIILLKNIIYNFICQRP